MKFKLTKEIIVSSITLCFSFLAAISGTMAWFSASTAAHSTFDNVKCIDTNVKNISYELFYYDEDLMVGKKATSTNEENVNMFVLDKYDSFITSRNEKIDKIMRVKIEHNFPLTDDKKIEVKAACSANNIFKDGSEYVDTKISNIIQFQCFLGKNIDINGNETYNSNILIEDSAEDDEIFTLAHSYFKNDVNKDDYSCFIDKASLNLGEGINPTKNSSQPIMFCDDIITIPKDTITTIIYIDYTYNPTLVDYFFDHSEFNKNFDVLTKDEISFSDDITSITLHFNEVN